MSGTHAAITAIEQTTYELLTYLHRGGRWFYYWTNPGKRSHWRPVGNPNPVPNGRANIYFGVHPTNERKSENERARIADVAAISCLFAEFDAKDFNGDKTVALTHVDGLDPPPSAVIDSGGGYHCYWLLAEPYTLTTASKRERARTVQRRWVELVGGDPGAKDLARVLRVPGTRNLKYDERPPVTVVRADFDRLYDLDVLEALLPRETPVSMPKARSADGGDAWAEAALADELAKMAMATEGTRNNTLNRAAYALGQIVGAGYLTRTEVEQGLYRAGLLTGLSESETWATINSGIAAGLKRPRGPKEKERNRPANLDHPQEERGSQNPTDLGNARRLVQLHGADLRYCHPWKRWFVWDARRWAKDDTGEVMRRAKDTVRLIYAEATNIPDEDGRKAVAKHAMRSEGVQRLRAMITLGESEPGIPVLPIGLDRDPWRLNVLNGTLDLRTGELRPHSRSDHITKLAPVYYDPAATCPLWLSFLDHIMGGNAELVRFLQRAVGYSLTGDTSEQVVFIFYGTGANGKTTLLKTVGSMVGDYGQQTPIDTLMVRRGNTIPNDVARLRGARFVTAVEAEEGQRLAVTVRQPVELVYA
jgi:hypothetical protein